jgi:hypothetical protein
VTDNPSTEGPAAEPVRGALTVGVLCGLIALVVLVLRVVTVVPVPVEGPGESFAPAYRPPTDHLQVLYNAHDGQAFASLAMDPLLRRPSDWVGGRAQLAYRAARPLVGWLAWAGAAGRPGAVEWSLAVISVLSVGLLGYAVARLAGTFGLVPFRSLLVLVTPGMVVVLVNPGLSDALGAALALLGAVRWRGGHRTSAVVLLCLAALSRDTCLLVAAALLLDEVWSSRSLRKSWPLLAAPATYLGWLVVVRARVGAWPTAYHGNLSLPFVGLAQQIGRGWSLNGAMGATLTLALLGAAALRRPPRLLALILGLYASMAACSGALVWASWGDGLTRSLLAGEAVAAVWLLLPRARVEAVDAPDGGIPAGGPDTVGAS